MSGASKTALEAVLALPPEERVAVAEQILASVEQDEEHIDRAAVDAAWAAEADRRYQAYKRGESKSVPIEEIFKMLEPRKGA
ncbi:MAG: putative addiction module component [Phycisphaerales bacterium]|jgi:putative addiction module component (TIGR02574 family)|nr:putative addiction module component [Phycisphaerales bacterium]HWE94596.1 addiction module protein [Tepidisphaeraceae bacterium]